MKYDRPEYGAEDVRIAKRHNLFVSGTMELPIPDYPIKPKENFIRAAKRENPIWVPNTLIDVQSYFARGPVLGTQGGPKSGNEFSDGERYVDWFGSDWTWVKSAGGPMLTPGAPVCLDEITNWGKKVAFPKLESMPWKEQAYKYMRDIYDPDLLLNINIGSGCTERLVAILGGYVEAMLSMAIEPAAVQDFLNAFADFSIRQIDVLCELFPLDMITIHDDWGTERDTFFSEKMMEEIVYRPMKKIADHIKSKGKLFELHSCGQITRFIPYMISMGVDFMQIQRRAVDIPAIKVKFGDKIGIDTRIENIEPGKVYSKEEVNERIHKTVDLYAKGGGFMTSTQFGDDPRELWDGIFELYCYSREYYDK